MRSRATEFATGIICLEFPFVKFVLHAGFMILNFHGTL